MSVLKQDCKTVRSIWAAEAAGKHPDGDEQVLVRRHVTQCESCRAEAEAVDILRSDTRALAAPPLDDLTMRRWIDGALERAEGQDKTGTIRRSPATRARIWIPAAAAAVLVISLAVLTATRVREARPVEGELAEQVEPPAAADPGARVLLVAGAARIGEEEASLSSTIASGDWLEVDGGGMAVELAGGIDAMLDSGTRARISRATDGGVDLHLSRGRVVARIDPERHGAPFTISTDRGRVLVTGTVLSVRAEARSVEVAVYRGSVRIEEDTATPQSLKVGESMALGGGERVAIADDDRAFAETMLTTLDLVSAPEAATVTIDSVPAGATVTVGDLDLGSTPLTVALRPGYRRVRLHKAGRESVQELINLQPDTEMTRVFELAESAPEANVEGGEADSVARAERIVRPGASTPGELLFRAQALRRAGRWQAAVEAYDELIRRHPASAEAGSSRVSKGSILLERLRRPGAALRSFDSYLKGSRHGTLAQEAAFGRISALRALGRQEKEREAIARFLEEFPDAIQRSRVRHRLTELEGENDGAAGSSR
jgi:hypothetical protein